MNQFSTLVNFNTYVLPQQNSYHKYDANQDFNSPTTESLPSISSSINSSTNSDFEFDHICDLIPSDLFSDNFTKPDFGATKSSLIREGLKVSLRSKLQQRKVTETLVTHDHIIQSTPLDSGRISNDQLTPEDEEKRKERREKNKIAAKKCRKKRKFYWRELMTLDEKEDKLNSNLKTESEELKEQIRRLQMLLDYHKCVKIN